MFHTPLQCWGKAWVQANSNQHIIELGIFVLRYPGELLKPDNFWKYDHHRAAGNTWGVAEIPQLQEPFESYRGVHSGQGTGEMRLHSQLMHNNCTDCTFGRNMLGTAGKHGDFIFIISDNIPFRDDLAGCCCLGLVGIEKGVCPLRAFEDTTLL